MSRKLRPRPGVASRFFKAHGQGNDYLVFDEGPGPALSPALVRRICSRRRGVGADGVVVVEAVAPGAEARLRMFNPDGGEFERSGNGLRIAGVYLRREGRSPRGSFPVVVGGSASGGDRVVLEVDGPGADGTWDVRVEMGRADFPVGPPFVAPGRVRKGGRVVLGLGRRAPPGSGPSRREPGREPRRGQGARAELEAVPVSVALTPPVADEVQHARLELEAVPVAVGNPHAVIFGDGPWGGDAVGRLGPLVSAHEAFPEGTNVQFAWVPERGRAAGDGVRATAEASEEAAGGPQEGAVSVAIWERGVGRTESSGTSACAAAVAAVREGMLPPGPVRVEMEGGAMEVEVGADWAVRLRGPVEEVCVGELSETFLAETFLAESGPPGASGADPGLKDQAGR